EEVDVLPGDGRGELRNLVETGLVPAPVVPGPPVLGQPPHGAERHAVPGARPGQLTGPPGRGQPRGQVVQVALRYVDAERLDLCCRRHTGDATDPSGQFLS